MFSEKCHDLWSIFVVSNMTTNKPNSSQLKESGLLDKENKSRSFWFKECGCLDHINKPRSSWFKEYGEIQQLNRLYHPSLSGDTNPCLVPSMDKLTDIPHITNMKQQNSPICCLSSSQTCGSNKPARGRNSQLLNLYRLVPHIASFS